MALADADVAVARQALSMYGGELLPQDRYEAWAELRREELRLRHLDLLRLDGRWETVVELDARTSAHISPSCGDTRRTAIATAALLSPPRTAVRASLAPCPAATLGDWLEC